MMRTRTPERTRRRASTRPVGPAPQTRTSKPCGLLIATPRSRRGAPKSGRSMRPVEKAGQARGHSGILDGDVATLARVRLEVVDLHLPREHRLAHALPSPHP